MFGSTGERVLQEKYGTVKRAEAFYDNQMSDCLNDAMREFIEEQQMVFIATADAKGHCDTSIRTGAPGVVRVIDERTLMYPEYRGNGVMASLGNIAENPHIGMLFVDFFKHCIGLHVNGAAEIIENEEIQSRLKVDDKTIESLRVREGRLAERYVVVTVHEAYIHCAKHIPLLKQLDKEIYWGTDDEGQKGGDFFGVKAAREERKWVTSPETHRHRSSSN